MPPGRPAEVASGVHAFQVPVEAVEEAATGLDDEDDPAHAFQVPVEVGATDLADEELQPSQLAPPLGMEAAAGVL